MSTVEAALACDVGGEVDREAVGVVQTEGVGAGNAAAGLASHCIEQAHAVFERLAEAVLFGAQRVFDERLLLRQFRIGLAHLLDQRLHHLPEEIAAHAEHPAVAQRATDDAA